MTNIILYNLSCGGWGTYSDWLFTNINNPSPSQFNHDVEALIKKYGKEYLEQEESWACFGDWVTYIVNKLSELGYERAVITNVFIPTQGIIRDLDDQDLNNSFRKIVGKELFDLAVKHNERIEEEL